MTAKLDRLQLITTFLAVAEMRSISSAGRSLGTTQSTVSRRLRQLEHLLNVRLAVRSTHRFHLTPEGEELQRRATAWADVWTEWEEALHASTSLPKGKLTLIGPHGYGHTLLMEAVKEFRFAHPQVEVELRLTDRQVDLVGQAVDCWIRVGGSTDQSMHVRGIGRMRRILVASREFAEKHPVRAPGELEALPFVGLIPHVMDRLVLHSRQGERCTVRIHTPMRTDGLLASYRAILDGLGVGASARWLCGADLAAGRLKRVLPQWELEPIAIEAVSVAGRYRPARINTFVEILCRVLRRLEGFEEAEH
jgi:DNA-binding transcriptional LysR family regulator